MVEFVVEGKWRTCTFLLAVEAYVLKESCVKSLNDFSYTLIDAFITKKYNKKNR